MNYIFLSLTRSKFKTKKNYWHSCTFIKYTTEHHRKKDSCHHHHQGDLTGAKCMAVQSLWFFIQTQSLVVLVAPVSIMNVTKKGDAGRRYPRWLQDGCHSTSWELMMTETKPKPPIKPSIQSYQKQMGCQHRYPCW